MSFHFNVYSAIFFATAVVSAAVALYAWRRRTLPGAMLLMWLMIAGAEWALAAGLEAAAVGIPAKVFWSKVEYIGADTGPVLFLMFALAYSRPTQPLARRVLALAWVIPITTILLAATNEWHHLIWTGFNPGTVGDNILVYHHGILFYIAVTYFYLVIAWGALILIRATVRRKGPYRGQILAVIVGALMPLATAGLYIAGLSPVPGLDISPVGFMFAGLALGWGVLQFQLLDIVPVARDLLFESMSDGVLVLDLQNRIVDINPAAQLLVDATPDVIGQSAEILLASRPDLIETFRHMMEGQAEVVFGDPVPRHLDLRISPVRDRRGQITGRLVLLRDITEHKLAEDALRESEAVYRAMFAKNQAVKLLIDPKTAVIVDANEAACRFYGYSLGEIKAKKISEINTLSDSEVRAAMGRAKAEERSYFLFCHRLASGEIRDVEVYSSPIEVRGRTLLFSIIHDITERKRAEDTLREQQKAEQRFSQQLAALHEVSMELSIAGSSDDLCRLAIQLGRSRLDFDRMGIWFLDPDDPRYILGTFGVDEQGRLRDERRQRLPVAFGETWAMVLAGKVPLLYGPATEIRDDQGRLVGQGEWAAAAIWDGREVIGQISIDNLLSGQPITERQRALLILYARMVGHLSTLKRAEEALQRSNIELQARAEELDAFAHTVAHDLKTPLNVISGYAELLTEVDADLSPEDVHQNARTIMEVVGKMAGIIDSLLLLASARQERIPLAPLKMAEIVAEAQGRLVTEIARRRAEITLPSTWPVVTGYAPWVEAVWVNYLSNALRYGGRPDLTPPLPPRIELAAQIQADGQVRFTVRDNGQGIAAEDQEHLFTPFTRVGERRDAGHGLGLSIVRRIVERLGGQVGLESTPGAGSTFYFTLPGNS